MKAVVIDRFGGPEVLRYSEVPKPVPNDEEVLVRNAYIGVGKPDFLVRSGKDTLLAGRFPNLVIGNECAGIIEAVGREAGEFRPGQKVVGNSGLGYGAYAEYIAVPKKFVTVLPEEYPLQSAPGFLNYLVAYALLNEAGRGTDGQSLYIRGAAGGIGTALIQTALLQGIDVIASASTDQKCEYIRTLGAQCVFNYNNEQQKDVILDHTGGRGVDLIYDERAGVRFREQFDYLADFGMILLYNWLEGCPSLDQLDTVIEQANHASAIRFFSFHVYDHNPERLEKIRRICIERIVSGQLKPVLYDDLPLSEARRAHEQMDRGEVMGKLILHV